MSVRPDPKSLEDHKTQITTEHSFLPADCIETCVYGFVFHKPKNSDLINEHFFVGGKTFFIWVDNVSNDYVPWLSPLERILFSYGNTEIDIFLWSFSFALPQILREISSLVSFLGLFLCGSRSSFGNNERKKKFNQKEMMYWIVYEI